LSNIFGKLHSKDNNHILLIFTLITTIIIVFLFTENMFSFDICPLCKIQQAIYYDIFIICNLFFCSFIKKTDLLLCTLVLFFTGFSFAFYQVGLEQYWWEVSGLCQYNYTDFYTNSDSNINSFTSCGNINLSYMGFSLALCNSLVSLFMFLYLLLKLFFRY
jgi:disulfide bond formation protein DsbB